MRRSILAAATLLLLAPLAPAQSPEPTRTLRSSAPQAWAQFGTALAAVGDLTGDGVPELVVGSGRQAVGAVQAAGRAEVFDGRSGLPLFALTSPAPERYGHFGDRAVNAGDVNEDGTPDLAVSAYSENNQAGRVYVFSGADGALLRALASPQPQQPGYFGHGLARAWDTDLDGWPDVVVGAPYEGGDLQPGRAHVFSGRDGALLHTFVPPAPVMGGEFGTAVAEVDVWGNGLTATAIGERFGVVGGVRAGQVHVFDGFTQALRYTLVPPEPREGMQFGACVAGAGDVTGDGREDLLVCAPGEAVGGHAAAGRVYLFDGRDGAFIRAFAAPVPQEFGGFGGALGAAGDLDGDGRGDYFAGAAVGPNAHPDGEGDANGRGYFFSGATGAVLLPLLSPYPDDVYFAGTFANLGDRDGDGRPDFAVSASATGEGRGAVYVYGSGPHVPFELEAPQGWRLIAGSGPPGFPGDPGHGGGPPDFPEAPSSPGHGGPPDFPSDPEVPGGGPPEWPEDPGQPTPGEAGPPPARLALDAPAPNPAAGPVTVRFVAPPEAFRLYVFDALGREVGVLASGVGTGRPAEVAWRPDGLRAGVYVLRLVGHGARAARRVTLL